MEKMTRREFYVAINENTELSTEIREFAGAELEKLNVANEKRRNALSKKAQENAPLKEALLHAVGTEPLTATDLSTVIGCSVQKTSALMRQLCEAGEVQKTEVKIKGKGKQTGYILPA